MDIPKRGASMADVAAAAGVSVTTVSHVLNDVPGKRISPATRARVHAAAAELGYVLNGVARSLRTRRSHVIAMIGDEIAITPHAYGIIAGAQQAASRLGWLLVHINTGVERGDELAEINALRQRQVDGFLYARMYNREVILPAGLQGLPTVLVDGTCPDPSISSVVPDEFGGARSAVGELVRHGHRRIGFINNVDDIPAARGRLAGYRSVLEEAGIQFRPDYVTRAVSDARGGLAAAGMLLDRDDPPSALFCFNDRVAMGGYHAVRERGLRIPQDVSFVGFDNQENVADGLFPGLSTVALPHYEMGAWGLRTLADMIERPGLSAPTQIALACPLVMRESIAVVPGHRQVPSSRPEPADPEQADQPGRPSVVPLRAVP